MFFLTSSISITSSSESSSTSTVSKVSCNSNSKSAISHQLRPTITSKISRRVQKREKNAHFPRFIPFIDGQTVARTLSLTIGLCRTVNRTEVPTDRPCVRPSNDWIGSTSMIVASYDTIAARIFKINVYFVFIDSYLGILWISNARLDYSSREST